MHDTNTLTCYEIPTYKLAVESAHRHESARRSYVTCILSADWLTEKLLIVSMQRPDTRITEQYACFCYRRQHGMVRRRYQYTIPNTRTLMTFPQCKYAVESAQRYWPACGYHVPYVSHSLTDWWRSKCRCRYFDFIHGACVVLLQGSVWYVWYMVRRRYR